MLEFYEEERGVWTALGETRNYTITRVDRSGPAFDVRQDLYDGWDSTLLQWSFSPTLESAKLLANLMETKTVQAEHHLIRVSALRNKSRMKK